MQLKMSKPFNANFVRQMLQRENEFISGVFSKMPLPLSEIADQTQEPEAGEKVVSKAKVFSRRGETSTRAQSYEELQAKLEGLRNVKKLEHKQKLLKKNLKNRIKKKSKKDERLTKKFVKMEPSSAGSSKIKSEDTEAPKAPRPKPVFNSEGKMVFSKFDFSEIGAKKKPPKNEKDPRKILQQLQEKREKIKELEQTGDKEKAEELKEKEAWKAALAKVSGEKVKDDPDLLKNTIKRRDQKKKQSGKKWEARLQGVQKTMKERQEKRQENLLKRKKEKKLNKLKKSAKKGRVVSGF